MALSPVQEEYVDVIVRSAQTDASIARVLLDICLLDAPARRAALALVGAHLRTRAIEPDVLDCVAALERDEIARRILERLDPAG